MEFKQLLMPKALMVDEETLTDSYGKFVAEPFERGYGVTIGNSLRRILLSSVQGAAVTAFRIEGARHEFASIEGVKEDISVIILNLKSLRLQCYAAEGEGNIYLDVHGPAVVSAGDFEVDPGIVLLNSEQHIATLSVGAHLRMEAAVSVGRGYVPASEFKHEDDPIGVIPVDAVFSPILNVSYKVEAARVGQHTDYDRLIIEVMTDGSVKPEDAVSYSAKVLRDQLALFIKPEDMRMVTEEPETEEEAVSPMAQIEEKLDKSIEELELSVRSFNCLEAAGIKTIRDLVQKTEQEMLKYRNFGRKSLNEIKGILRDMGLRFNMKLDENGLPIMTGEEAE
ncbi:MAG: DNA-directed RNA polymerase subunit alpha [Candidatus Sumerlaeota bacterium]|nr:DNA-directed RNA polymerase subunit alpha [Candidatus Sumerlaeota bacterium]